MTSSMHLSSRAVNRNKPYLVGWWGAQPCPMGSLETVAHFIKRCDGLHIPQKAGAGDL